MQLLFINTSYELVQVSHCKKFPNFQANEGRTICTQPILDLNHRLYDGLKTYENLIAPSFTVNDAVLVCIQIVMELISQRK